MASVRELQGLVDRVNSGSMPTDELLGLVHHQSPLVRVNALEALVAGAKQNRKVLDVLIAAVSDPANGVRMMGTISLAHIALGFLLRVGTAEAFEAAKSLWSAWPEPDRVELTSYLESAGLRVG